MKPRSIRLALPKPRNPLVAATRARHAGAHTKTTRSQARQARDLQDRLRDLG